MSRVKMALRFIAVALGSLLVLALAITFEARQVTTVSIGAFAEQDYDHAQKKVRLTNAGGGKRTGRFIVYSTSITTRYPVVLVLISSDVTDSKVTVFTGSCAGIRVTPIPNCPCPAPFVLVTGVSPEDSGSSAKTD